MKFILNPKDQTGKRIAGKITKKVSPGIYLITDSQGHKIKVAGEGYQVGETVVSISGQIVSRTRTSIVPQVFQV